MSSGDIVVFPNSLMGPLGNLKITLELQSKKAVKNPCLHKDATPPGQPTEKEATFKATGHGLTTEGDDVAAVLVDKLPCDGLLHDLLHLEGRGSWTGDPNATRVWSPQRAVSLLLGFSGRPQCFDNCFPFIPSSPRLLLSLRPVA